MYHSTCYKGVGRCQIYRKKHYVTLERPLSDMHMNVGYIFLDQKY